MRGRKLIALFITILLWHFANAQQVGYEEADIKSYELYQKGDWKELLRYGKEYTATSPDFVLLRLRMGYAAFMLGNFSEALHQYDGVLKKDSYNETAHYYSWLCRRYLNQYEQADAHLKYFSEELVKKEKIKRYGFTGLDAEISSKFSNVQSRQNALYVMGVAHGRGGYGISYDAGVGSYEQIISERKLTAVTQNNEIDISQMQLYFKITASISSHLQLKAGYHNIHTPFNNFTYDNNIWLVGIRYNDYFFSVRADADIAKITDTATQQYNLGIDIYPMGNLDLYVFSTGSVNVRNSHSFFTVKEVIGFKALKKLWIECNGTFGGFRNYMENDALYFYNAIDRNKIKLGVTGYYTLNSKYTLQAGYTFEQRELYLSPNTFYQHSITGGISCRF